MKDLEVTQTEAPPSANLEKTVANLPRNAALDGLRGVAILLVLASQYWAHVPHVQDGVVARVMSKLTGYGVTGVTLFFVLSGFWIARHLIAHHGQSGYFGRYFLRRAARILPAYGLLLIAALVAAKVLFPMDADLWEPTVSEHLPRWAHLAFMQNVFMALTGSMGCEWLKPTWSLAVEAQFYLLLPVVVWFFTPRWLPVAACLGILVSWVFRGLLEAHELRSILASLTLPGRADALFLGVLVACVWEHGAAQAWLLRHRRGITWIGAGAAITFVALRECVDAGTTGVNELFAVLGGGLLAMGCAALILSVLFHGDGAVARCLAARPLRFWGGISFFAYLAHQPVNSLVHATLLKDWAQTISAAGMAATLLSVAIVAGLGAASRRWLEGPIVAWSRRTRASVPRLEAMPQSYVPPAVRWGRALFAALRRPKMQPARAVLRVR